VADALSPLDVAALLQATGTQLAAELGALPEAVLRHHPAPGEWCAKEVLGHLIEAERRGFAGRIRTLLAEDRPTFVGWEPADVGRRRLRPRWRPSTSPAGSHLTGATTTSVGAPLR